MKKTIKDTTKSAKWTETWLDRVDWNAIDIPIMKGIKNEGATSRASFHILKRLADIGEQIVYSSSRFRSRSQVYRSAMYIGLSILYRICDKSGEINSYGRAFFESIKRNERRIQQTEIVEMLVDEMSDLMDRAGKGIIPNEDVKDAVADMVASVPKDIDAGMMDMVGKALMLRNIQGGRSAQSLEKSTMIRDMIQDNFMKRVTGRIIPRRIEHEERSEE